ncbi:MAG: DNA-3-methyladenine glycosylase 2 family protein [Clostridia bacterium]|nr:DNA-3-methyladenine glycosylase 2 family protein [Clostridia bacterium]
MILYDTSEEDFLNIWKDYFDLDRDYGEIIEVISENEVLKAASGFAGGIRILRQDPWEALCSFIISQNNNIPRIKGIVERLCASFGEEIKEGFYSFPTAEKIAALTLEDLAPLRSGFRAKYILDGAKRVASGEIDLDALKELALDEARQELMKIYGVGEKVADCTLLFGLSHIDAFPKDVWIKKAMAKLFDGSLPECAAPYAGIAQQYIFHYARMTKLEI